MRAAGAALATEVKGMDFKAVRINNQTTNLISADFIALSKSGSISSSHRLDEPMLKEKSLRRAENQACLISQCCFESCHFINFDDTLGPNDFN